MPMRFLPRKTPERCNGLETLFLNKRSVEIYYGNRKSFDPFG